MSGVIAIDWAVACHSLPNLPYVYQLGGGHCDLEALPERIDTGGDELSSARGKVQYEAPSSKSG